MSILIHLDLSAASFDATDGEELMHVRLLAGKKASFFLCRSVLVLEDSEGSFGQLPSGISVAACHKIWSCPSCVHSVYMKH